MLLYVEFGLFKLLNEFINNLSLEAKLEDTLTV
jgi:hypothetical protein